jgi:hypothetical protein
MHGIGLDRDGKARGMKGEGSEKGTKNGKEEKEREMLERGESHTLSVG